jgi:hypothetical protein
MRHLCQSVSTCLVRVLDVLDLTIEEHVDGSDPDVALHHLPSPRSQPCFNMYDGRRLTSLGTIMARSFR